MIYAQDLTLDEFAEVARIGDGRMSENASTFDSVHYQLAGDAFNLTNRQTQRLGAMVEGGIFKYYGGNIMDHSDIEWKSLVEKGDGYGDRLSGPDLFGFIEVKRTNRWGNGIPIKAKDLHEDTELFLQGYVPYATNSATGSITAEKFVVITGWALPEDYDKGNSFKGTDLHYVTPRSVDSLPKLKNKIINKMGYPKVTIIDCKVSKHDV